MSEQSSEPITQTPSEPEQAAPAPALAIPSPAAFAHHQPSLAATPKVSYSEADVAEAEKFGRVDENGVVYVKEGETERKVGEYPGTESKEALDLFTHRFLDIKSRVELFAARLKSSAIKTREINESLASLEKETASPDVVGDISALQKRFAEIKEQAAAKKEELSKIRQAAIEKTLERRNEIASKAEDLVKNLNDSTNWRETADKLSDLFQQWQKIQKEDIRVDRSKTDEIWKRFSAARTAFNQARRKWTQERDAQRVQVREAKEALIKEAESLKDSKAWGETSRAFTDLMNRWKVAGRTGRQSEDDAMWKRFRAAADTFFDARQADRDSTNADEKENLAKKEELLAKAEALLPVADEKAAAAARQQLGAIQDQWDVIGRVPRGDMNRIESRLEAVEKKIAAVEEAAWSKTDPETSARKSSFASQLQSQLAELDAKIAAESDESKKKALEAEKATKQQWLNAIA
jgi:hypothetical protein